MDHRTQVTTVRDEHAEHADEQKHKADCTKHGLLQSVTSQAYDPGSCPLKLCLISREEQGRQSSSLRDYLLNFVSNTATDFNGGLEHTGIAVIKLLGLEHDHQLLGDVHIGLFERARQDVTGERRARTGHDGCA